jgi:hypothetical protein
MKFGKNFRFANSRSMNFKQDKLKENYVQTIGIKLW